MQGDELLDVAVRAAHRAGDVLVAGFGGPASGLSTKSSDTDPVSDADRSAEAAVLEVLRAERPGDGVIGEEGANEESSTGLRWVVDPLDGTVNFLYGVPHFAVSIAVEDDDGPVAGVVFDPMRSETFSAVRGRGARLNGEPIGTSEASDLSRSMVATGFGYDPEHRTVQARVLSRLIHRIRDVRRAGTASLDLAWTACGRLDGYFESGLKPWDLAAGQIIVTEAGGRIGRLPRPMCDDPGVVASAPAIYEPLRDLLDESLRDH